MPLQGIETVRPLDPVWLQPCVQLLERLRAEPVETPVRVLPGLDESCIAQNL